MSNHDGRGRAPGGPPPQGPAPSGQPQHPNQPAPYGQAPNPNQQAPHGQPQNPNQPAPYGQAPNPNQPAPHGQPRAVPGPPQDPSQQVLYGQQNPYRPVPYGPQNPYQPPHQGQSQNPHQPPPYGQPQNPLPQAPYAQPQRQPQYPMQAPHASPMGQPPFVPQQLPQAFAPQHAHSAQQAFEPQPRPVPRPGAIVHRQTHLISTVRPPTGHGFGAMAVLSLKRAFRLRIDPNEILEDERFAMAKARPPITDETQQAFLAWRRSVLFMAALIMVPVGILHAYENLHDLENLPEAWKTLTYLSVGVEAGFAVFLWTQVRRWTAWKRQARTLSWAWLIYFLTPFLVFLYPLASALDFGEATGEQRHQMQLGFGFLIGAQALVSLAPKVISLLQGLIRASIATKTLFPGASAPGWLMVIAAPLYMIIFYIFVLLPYHFTSSGFVVAGILLVLVAKGSLVRAGLGLTKPMLGDAARNATHKALKLWMALLITGAACIVGGLWTLISRASPLTLINFALSMGANILLLTLIATDALITALDRAHGSTTDERRLADEAAGQIAAFTAIGTHDPA